MARRSHRERLNTLEASNWRRRPTSPKFPSKFKITNTSINYFNYRFTVCVIKKPLPLVSTLITPLVRGKNFNISLRNAQTTGTSSVGSEARLRPFLTLRQCIRKRTAIKCHI